MSLAHRRKARRVIWILALGFLGMGLSLFALLVAWSPGRPQPFLDEHGKILDGSLSEKIHVPINGTYQGMFVKSKDSRNPVLLFVHGGPGMPEYWLTQRYPTHLEDYFTIVWWEQRGAGLSYYSNIPPDTMTTSQFVSDTLTVTHYLINRFGHRKIYLMGHSWGSYIGIQAAAKEPDLYHAYIAIGQISYQLESEHVAYKYALAQYKLNNNTRMLRKLSSAPPTVTVPLPVGYEAIRDEYMHDLGIGTTHTMRSVVTGIFLPSWQFREYSLTEKINLWRGKIYSRSQRFGLWQTMLATDMTQRVPQLAVPVYFLHGKMDYTCAYTLAMNYFKILKAPLKGFYTFENSAHSPIFEEPQRVLQILLGDVLASSNALADK